MQIHPAYDLETKTWFLEQFKAEAPTIAELIQKLPPHIRKDVQVKDYYIRHSAPTPKFKLATAEEFIRRPNRPISRTLSPVVPDLIPRQKPAKSAASESIPAEPLPQKRRIRKYRQKAVVIRDWIPRSAKDFTEEEKKKIENQILDMWADGKTGPDIAQKLQLSVTWVGAQVIPRYRKLGDPRAVVRNPLLRGTRAFTR